MKKFKIDHAPGKDLILKIIKNKSFKDFEEFYNLRVNHYRQPIIHDHLVTYGIFEDLIKEYPHGKQVISMFIDYSIRIAEQEKDKNFISAIFLINELSSKYASIPTAEQFTKLSKLRIRASKLSYVPNMCCFWNNLVYFLCRGSDLSRKDYMIYRDKEKQ